ncbi:MAG: RagB/SusD family nutrient uptake outer membrane protein [Tannerella sp.]|jgi:hypothetical protein|nr:RagB/SusD family nutrient uptake outer membrane protein [Tannerella sp.]
MKSNHFFLITFLILAVSNSCRLDKEPLTTLSPSSFWNTEQDLRMALNSIYRATFLGGFRTDLQTIDAYGSNPNTISSGTYTPSNTDDYWGTSYTQIRTANSFLENYQKANIDENLKRRYAGEARFFRAYFYTYLLQRFGDIPYVDKTLDLASPELYAPRTPRAEVLNKILEDIQYAVDNIPEKSAIPSDVGRITKGAALTLQARVALYFGTLYKFHNLGEYRSLLTLAKTAAGLVIDSREYALYDDYRNLFLQAGNDNSESIMTLRHTPDAGPSTSRSRQMVFDFSFSPTKYLADAFLCSDGLPIDKSPLFQGYLPLGTEFSHRDPRMALTLWRPYDPDYQVQPQPFIPSFAANTTTGYMFKKYAADISPSYTHDLLMRYAEVLLIYAEAAYEIDESVSDSDLNISINTLRKRFSSNPDCLPDLTNAFVTENNLNMREEIRRERRVELAGETFRYGDLIRWKTAETELPQDILGAKLDKNVYPSVEKPLTPDGFIVLQYAATRTFNKDRDYLFPLPLLQLSLNKNLIQNPNW